MANIQEAIDTFDTILKIDPGIYFAWDGKALIAGIHSNYTEELACFKKAIDINPNDSYAYHTFQ